MLNDLPGAPAMVVKEEKGKKEEGGEGKWLQMTQGGKGEDNTVSPPSSTTDNAHVQDHGKCCKQ
jgi:hypothetical protein